MPGTPIEFVETPALTIDVDALGLAGSACGLRVGDKVELTPWYYSAANDRHVRIRQRRLECIWDIAARGAHQ